MKYLIFCLIIIFFTCIFICYKIRKRWAIKKVILSSNEEKLSYINLILNPFGFEFDLDHDIIISSNNSWQRDIGYCDLYDIKAPFINIVMDCEPIYFDYNNKHYRIEFWKGQYGITSGAEVGIYIKDFNSKIKDYYRCAKDCERLKMGFILYKNCNLFSRCDLSWWLTGFDIGKFTSPKDLKLSICICFPNRKMQAAFIKGLLNAGYTKEKIEICDNYVCFNYCTPNNYKLNHRHKIIKCVKQIINYINCHLFLCFTSPFNKTIDKLTYLKYMMPHIYKFVIHLSIPRKKQKKYYKKKYIKDA